MWPILVNVIEHESDTIAVRQRARLVAELLGFGRQDQIRIATAVSEIARNAFDYAGGGRAELLVDHSATPQEFVIRISDRGRGIEDLEAVLDGRYRSQTGLGLGIMGARRLMDRCDIESGPDRGTVVSLGKHLPLSAPPLAPAQLTYIVGRLAQEPADDPMVILREQNRELIRSMDQLRERDRELQQLNRELEDTNRGVVALYAELDERAEQVRQSEERLSLALSSAEIGTWDYDPLTGRLRCDTRCKALFGVEPAAEVAYDAVLSRIHPEDRRRMDVAVQSALDPAGLGTIDMECRAIHAPEGGERWIAVKGRATFESIGESLRAVRFIGTVLDISVQKQAEALMQRTIEHQEILTREVSHRVKNSLALVAGLLGLQARAAGDSRVKRAIADAEMRIGTVARVHDHLWRQPEVSIVDLSAFLRDLCANLQATAPEQHCLVCEAEPIMVATDQAIPLGLLINELVTNAFKYAYPDGRGGEVRVRLNIADDARIRLEVSDQGVGLPEGFELHGRASKSDSLGMKLISGFARQLEGRVRVSSGGGGTRFEIDLPRHSA